MAHRNTDEVSHLDEALMQARAGTIHSDAAAFFAGFGDGFGFSGLFARLEQAPLPESTDVFEDEVSLDEGLVHELVGFNRAEGAVKPIPFVEANTPLRASK